VGRGGGGGDPEDPGRSRQLAAARGEPGSDGEVSEGRLRLRRPALSPPVRPPGVALPCLALPCFLTAVARAFVSGRGWPPGEVRPPPRRGASARGARHGRVRALHKGNAPRGSAPWGGATRPHDCQVGNQWGGGGGGGPRGVGTETDPTRPDSVRSAPSLPSLPRPSRARLAPWRHLGL
jgi:hypothetical protein